MTALLTVIIHITATHIRQTVWLKSIHYYILCRDVEILTPIVEIFIDFAMAIR